MHEIHTRTGKVTYVGGHTEDELIGIEIEVKGVPVNISLEKDGCKTTVNTYDAVKLSVNFEYEADALTALNAIIAAAIEAKRAIEDRHQNHARDLKAWANELKEKLKRCRVCGSTENLEAHHLESKHYSPNLMLSLGNGIVLCEQCHDEFHVFCGGKKASRHNFYRWLQTKEKDKTVSTITSKRHEKTSMLINENEFAKVMQYALQVKQETGEFPGRKRLKKMTGCSEYIAKKVAKELKMLE